MRNLSTPEQTGAYYFLRGWQLIGQPGLRLFVIIPLIVNTLLFAGLFAYILTEINQWIHLFMTWFPPWLQWLDGLLWLIAVVFIIFGLSSLFATIGNWIAAPFNGLLAERTELLLTGQPLPVMQWHELFTDLPRIFKRELQKFFYWLPRALLIVLAFFIPALGQTIVPILWFIFSSWMMAIQYIDYPYDNHKISFQIMRRQLNEHRSRNWSFGAFITLATWLPFINWLIMPVAICGATAIWVDDYRAQNGLPLSASVS